MGKIINFLENKQSIVQVHYVIINNNKLCFEFCGMGCVVIIQQIRWYVGI